MQQTLQKPAILSGIGLHKAVATTLRVLPADVNHGIVFKRVDITDRDNVIPARWDHVVDTQLCTVIGNKEGVTVATIEHLMAALRACGIDNAMIEIDAQEVPIMDGSSAPFVEAFDLAGIQKQSEPRRVIRVLKEVTYTEGDKTVSLSPSAVPVYAGELQYDNTFIGTQRFEIKLVNGNFRHDLADCRTFCLKQDVEMMQANGLALGGSLDNAVVVDDTGIMNEDGLRCDNEMIRHKLLDAIGDLALAGGLVVGAYDGVKIGHAMNNKLLHALFADDSAWEYADLYVDFEDDHSLIMQEPVSAEAINA